MITTRRANQGEKKGRPGRPTFESVADGLARFADRRRSDQAAAGLPLTKPSQRKRRKRRKVVEPAG